MNHYLVSLTLIASAALGACGGDLDPGAGDDPGGGTSTLLVNGSAVAEPQIPNARAAADFQTELSVRITLAGQPVTTGTVTVTSASATVPLTFRPDGNGGRWEGTAAGYDEVYVLDVESGADNAHGIRVDGPDIHTITAPTQAAALDSTVAIEVQWSSDDKAEIASLRVGDLDDIVVPDTGRYQLPPGTLRSEKDRARENNVRLRRENRVTPAGAVGGSEWTVRVDNSIQVLANPNPNA